MLLPTGNCTFVSVQAEGHLPQQMDPAALQDARLALGGPNSEMVLSLLRAVAQQAADTGDGTASCMLAGRSSAVGLAQGPRLTAEDTPRLSIQQSVVDSAESLSLATWACLEHRPASLRRPVLLCSNVC